MNQVLGISTKQIYLSLSDVAASLRRALLIDALGRKPLDQISPLTASRWVSSRCWLRTTYLLLCTYSLISNRRKKHNSDIKHITPQDQTYCFNYLIARKLYTQYLTTKSYCFFKPFWPNDRTAMGMTPNCSARYELTFRVLFNFLND